MAGNPSGFDVRCSCGATIHSSDAHIGRTIRCRCGRSLTIERPALTGSDGLLFGSTDVRKGRTKPHRASSRDSAGHAKRPGEILPRIQRALMWPFAALRADILGGSSTRRWVSLASVLILMAVVATWWFLILFSEELIPATLLAYGPRFVVLFPVIVGALASLVFARASLVVHAVSAAIVLGPIMGGRLHVVAGRGPIPPAQPSRLRVLTLNAEGGGIARQYVPELLHDVQPDLVAVQECGDALDSTLQDLRPAYVTARHHSLCILSRWPLSPVDSMPRAAFVRVSSLGFGGTALVARYRVAYPGRSLDFVTLHLETPRKGLERLMGNDGFIPDDGGLPRGQDVEAEQINARIRYMESERASAWAARFATSIPVIVAGDFNMPVESTIFRRFWTGFDDAFEHAGLGFGYTKVENRYIKARIDHVLYSPSLMQAVGAWVGPEVGSDHRPLIADLRLVQ